MQVRVRVACLRYCFFFLASRVSGPVCRLEGHRERGGGYGEGGKRDGGVERDGGGVEEKEE